MKKEYIGTTRANGFACWLLVVFIFFYILFSNFRKQELPPEHCLNLVVEEKGVVVTTSCSQTKKSGKTGDQQEISQFLFAPADINTASFAKLITIRGIGPKLAGQICQYRQKKRFHSQEELTALKGVGKKKAEKLGKEFLFNSDAGKK